MSPQPHGGAPDGRPSPRSRNAVMLLWFVALLAAAGLLWLLLVFSGVTEGGTSLIAVAWVLLILSFGVTSWARSKQRQRYRQRFPSLDDLRRHVDAEALRTVRDRDGRASAVRQLRRQVPDVPLADATKLIKSL